MLCRRAALLCPGSLGGQAGLPPRAKAATRRQNRRAYCCGAQIFFAKRQKQFDRPGRKEDKSIINLS